MSCDATRISNCVYLVHLTDKDIHWHFPCRSIDAFGFKFTNGHIKMTILVGGLELETDNQEEIQIFRDHYECHRLLHDRKHPHEPGF